MANHTPGPWAQRGTMVYAPGEHGANICEVSEPRTTPTIQHTRLELGSPDADEAYANADLIAAAPELLAMVKELAAPEAQGTINRERDARVAALIAKAEGRNA